jgi:hypothetical protein
MIKWTRTRWSGHETRIGEVRKKVKFSLSTAWRWIWGNVTPVLNLGTIWRWVVSSSFGRCTPRRGPRYPLSKRLTKPQSRSGLYGEDKNTFLLPEIEPRIFHQVVCYTHCAISSPEEVRNTYKIFVGKPEERKLFQSSRARKYNIQIGPKEWLRMITGFIIRGKWWTSKNMVMELRLI